jgi:hypothetical protein
MYQPVRRVLAAVATLLAALSALPVVPTRRDPDRERGDVPGWVLVTVMTAGLVAGLWAIAGPELERMLRQALNAVA